MIVKRSDVRIKDMVAGNTRLRGGDTVKAVAWTGVLNTVVRRLVRSE